MAQLHLHLLGPPEILAGEKRIPVPRRQPRTLLYYLAERARPVSRETLLSLLWREGAAPPAVLRNRLNVAVRRLKQSLPPGILQVDATCLALDPSRIQVDVWQFRAEHQALEEALHHHRPQDILTEALVRRIQAALALWRGPAFLEGERLQGSPLLSDWLQLTGDQLQQARIALIHRLVMHFRHTGHFDLARRWLQEWLSLTPLDTTAHAEWIQVCFLANDPAAAYAPLERLARQEPADAQLVREELQSRYPELLSAAAVDTALPPAASAPSRPALSLIGRDAALAQLHTAVQEGQGVLLLAPIGMGKTVLLDEFVRRLPQARRVLHHSCTPAEATTPWGTLTALLRQSVPADVWPSLAAPWRATLRAHLPALAPQIPAADPASPPHSHLESALHALITLLSRDHALLIRLDEAQYADPDSLQLLATLVPTFRRRAPVILAIDAAWWPRLRPRAEQWFSTLLWQRLWLEPLAPEDSHKLLAGRMGTSVSPAFAAYFHRQSGGNPALLADLLHHYLQQHPDAEPDIPPARLDYPPAWEEAYRQRWALLPDDLQHLMQTLVLLRQPADVNMLATLLQREAEHVRQACRELAAAGWVQSTPAQRWEPAHDLLRRVVQQLTPLSQRQRLHRRIADLLDRQSDAPLELGWHLEQAGERLQAMEYYLHRSRQWIAAGNILQATEALQQATDLLWQTPQSFPDSLVFQLALQWDHVCSILDRPAKLEAFCRRLQSLAQQRMSALLQGIALYGLADVCLLQNRFAEGLFQAQAARKALQEAGHRTQALWARTLEGVFHYMQGNIETAAQIFQQVARQAATSSSPPDEVQPLADHVRYQQALLAAFRGDPLQARDLGLQTLQSTRQSANAIGTLLALNNLATATLFLGEYRQARQYGHRAAELAERLHSMRFLGYAQVYRAWASLILGELEPALTWAYQAIGVGELHGHDEIKALGHRVVGDVYYWLEAPLLALEWYRKARRYAQHSFLEADLMLRIGIAQLRQRQAPEAERLFRGALELAQTLGQGYVVLEAHLALMDLWGQSGAWDRVLARLPAVQQQAHQRGLQAEVLQTLLLAAQAHWQLGDRSQALEGIQQLVQAANRVEHFWYALTALRLWYHWTAQQGDKGDEIKQRILVELARLQTGLRTYVDHKAVTRGLEEAAHLFLVRLRRELR